MKARILEALKKCNIEKYLLTQTVNESLECFFIRKKMDLKRRTDTKEYAVTVYHPFEKDGQKMLGSSGVQIYPGMELEEVERALMSAYEAAALVCNPYYELPKGEKKDLIPASGRFAAGSLEENMKKMAEALFSADTSEVVFINSAEFFAKKKAISITNSEGVDVSYALCEVSGEYVVQCTEPQDVETYHSFSYRDADTQALKKDAEDAIAMTKARAEASLAPKAGEYTLILSGEYMRTLFDYYLDRSGSGIIYQKYSNYKLGTHVQGDEIAGDALTILLKASEPYSTEGIPMEDRVLLEKGTLKTIHGGSRFAYYLGIEPTGEYASIEVPVGSMPFEEMKSGAYLHVVRFSDFQMDSFSGRFGGEIRLAFLCDGEKVIPVTGGSVNGSILESQSHMVFSKERYRNAKYDGPFAVRIEGIGVAGR